MMGDGLERLNQLLGSRLFFYLKSSKSINQHNADFFHILKIIWIKIFHKITQEMRILLLIIQKLPDYYYIFGYYISGWDHPTENVITENVINHIG